MTEKYMLSTANRLRGENKRQMNWKQFVLSSLSGSRWLYQWISADLMSEKGSHQCEKMCEKVHCERVTDTTAVAASLMV